MGSKFAFRCLSLSVRTVAQNTNQNQEASGAKIPHLGVDYFLLEKSFWCPPCNLVIALYSTLHPWLLSVSSEACLLLLFHAHFPSCSLVPRGVPSNQRSFDGEAVQGEAQGIMTETAGALVTASMFSKPAQRQSGNFPLNQKKKC